MCYDCLGFNVNGSIWDGVDIDGFDWVDDGWWKKWASLLFSRPRCMLHAYSFFFSELESVERRNTWNLLVIVNNERNLPMIEIPTIFCSHSSVILR